MLKGMLGLGLGAGGLSTYADQVNKIASGLASDSATHPATAHLPFANGERELMAFPQKKPMIVLTSRPVQLETPFDYFDKKIITPNDEFFVRYHLANIPRSINPKEFKLTLGGNVKTPITLTLNELKTKFTPQKVIAVNQCSGNSRGFFEPRVTGGQLGNGAMGNAEWVGVPLRDLLKLAGPGAGARQVSFNGLDAPVIKSDADFIKALDIDHALDGEVMVAYAMNGTDIPFLNGYPLKLIVPGYYGTYWVKHLSEINVINTEYNGFWMNPAYRIPDNDCNCVLPGTSPAKTKPISKFTIRSFITNLKNASSVLADQAVPVRGIAFDSGVGISKILFSSDDGQSWSETKLGQDLGKYSFRAWSTQFTPRTKGEIKLKVKAINIRGEEQPLEARWMAPGYMRNVVETVTVTSI
jgi:DMSO/TMAO reductase YedYZ molybdopterin-dependent catalytic subunit